MFRTGFLVRATHTLLTWVVTLILFLHNTGKFIQTGTPSINVNISI